MKKINWINKSRLLAIALAIFFQSCNDEEVTPSDIEDDSALIELTEIENHVAYEWTKLYLELERYSSGRPNASARGIAYIYLTAYETVVPSMEQYKSLDREFRKLDIDDDLTEDGAVNYQYALNVAFADALKHFLLNLDAAYSDQIDLLEENMEFLLSNGLTEEEIVASNSWGEYVAAQVIAYSQTDDDAEEQVLDPQPLSYEPPIADGYWTYSADPERALFPYWSDARTFVASTRETTTVDPIEYSNVEGTPYFDQMQEVYDLNNAAKNGDEEQLWIAEFWSDDVEGLMMSPPTRQVSIANQLVDQFNLELEETLVLMLKLGFSLNDAAVSTWKYKYEHMVMRPNVFIHEYIDADYQTNLYRLVYWPNPSFPGYPSGHSAFASAAGGVFIDVFGNNVTFTDRTHEGRTEFLGEPRTFSTIEEMAEENAYSRLPLGVHIRMDCDEGLRLGYEVADLVNKLDLTNKNVQ